MLVVTVVVIAGLVGLVVTERARGEEHRRSWWPTLAVTGAVLFVFWLPVAVQQITQDPGNVSQLVDFFGNHGREQRYEDAWHVLALQLGVWPDWLKGASTPSVIGTIDFSAVLRYRWACSVCSLPPCSPGAGPALPSSSTASCSRHSRPRSSR